MSGTSVALQIADPQAAIRYLGEMQSRPMDPIHEPIQNLLDEGARCIDVELDRRKNEIRIRGDSKPITSQQEGRRILQSVCSSNEVGRLGEKGVGMLSFVNVGTSMTMTSQKAGKIVWIRLRKDDLSSGVVGRDRGNRLPMQVPRSGLPALAPGP